MTLKIAKQNLYRLWVSQRAAHGLTSKSITKARPQNLLSLLCIVEYCEIFYGRLSIYQINSFLCLEQLHKYIQIKLVQA